MPDTYYFWLGSWGNDLVPQEQWRYTIWDDDRLMKPDEVVQALEELAPLLYPEGPPVRQGSFSRQGGHAAPKTALRDSGGNL